MLKHGVRRLVVVDEQGDSVGLITQSDIILGLESKYIEVYKELVRIKDNELRSTLSALEEKNILLDNILTSSIDMGIVATDTTFRITYSNPVAGEILGLPGELVGKELMSIDQLQEQFGSRGERVVEHLRSRMAMTFTYERESGERGKRFVQGRLSGILDKEKRLVGYVLMLTDVTERKLAEETIRFMAYHDILTGLPNRVLLNERLNMELIRAERNRLSFALLVIDLDQFKTVNDTFGHYAGDLLLKALAKRLKQLLRKSDTVARIGGDEFVIMLTEIQKAENAWAIAEKIVNSLEQNVIIEGREVRVTVSLGISLFPDHGSTADLLVQRADSAMYRAKEMNRNNRGSNICLASRP
jgi:diguanylate cyclase (GGDEF)-like protein/PAS domain S-box-containing protein